MTAMQPWYTDPRMLDAGDVRGLSDDPTPASIPTDRAADDLNVAAEHLGVNVADLVAARRKLGVTHRRRGPSLLARLLRKG